jgi:hypothetical protein
MEARSRETQQLRLVEGGRRPDWMLDEKTRRVGRQGIAQARQVLQKARPPEPVRKAS